MQVQTRHMTVAEYLAYGDQPVEVINGEAIMAAAAHTRRQPNIVTNLFDKLHPFVRKNKLGKVFSEASYVLDGNPRTKWVAGARTPDVSFISRERIEAHNAEYPDDEPWWLAPDLAVEVISPTDSYDYLSQKVADYLSAGVKLVWVIDAEARSVRVFAPDHPLGYAVREPDKLTAESVIPGWSMKVSDLFVAD